MARSENVTFGDVTYEPRSTHGPRVQQDFQLVIIHAGESSVTVDGTRHLLQVGHASLFKPGARETFSFSRSSQTHHTWCAVHPRRLPKAMRAELSPAPFSLPLTSRLQALMELGLSSPASASPTVTRVIDILGESVFQEYLALAELGIENKASLLPNSVRRAKDLIDTHSADPLTVELLAKTACCTPNHLIKLFRQHLGITPSRYLWQTRVHRGVELLRQTGLSVSEIADHTGFQTPFHFSRSVKEQYELPPKKLRQLAWNPAPLVAKKTRALPG